MCRSRTAIHIVIASNVHFLHTMKFEAALAHLLDNLHLNAAVLHISPIYIQRSTRPLQGILSTRIFVTAGRTQNNCSHGCDQEEDAVDEGHFRL